MKPCPYCAEEIQDAAIVCRFCGRDLEQSKPVFEYKTALLSFEITKTQILITDKTNLKNQIAPKQTSIAIKNISGVTIKGFLRKLELTMNDGSRRDLPAMGPLAEQIQKTLLTLL